MNLRDIKNTAVAGRNKALLDALAPEPKRSKYGSQKTVIDGEVIDSKKEAKRYGQLKIRLKIGELIFLARQVEFSFHIEGQKIASYFADLVYMEAGKSGLIVEDVKSPPTRLTPAYRLKKKMMKAQHGIIIREV